MCADNTSVYHGNFKSWVDVQREFQTKAAEPAELIYAGYDQEQFSFDGNADIAWLNDDGSISYVLGSHNSMCGLEGQFEPEIYSAETALLMIGRHAEAFDAATQAIKAALDGCTATS